MTRIILGYRRKESQGGFTFLEMLIALAVTALGFSAFLGIALTTVQDFEFFTTLNQITQWNQQVINDIRDETLSTKQYFGNDTRGLGYYSALALPPMIAPINTTTLPTIDDEGTFEMDTAGNAKTGNALFFARTLEPFVTTVQMDATTFSTFRINVYTMCLYYLSLRVGDTIGGSQNSLDLVRWSSTPFADYAQIMGIQDPDPTDFIFPQSQIIANFVNQYNSSYLWDSVRDVDQAFYFCDSSGYVDTNPDPIIVIPQDPINGVQSAIPGGFRAGKRTSICMNNGTAGFQGGPRVPLYAIPSTLNDGFPHGFEVQIIGPSGARKLLMRLAMCKEGSSRLIGKDFKAILTTRDF